MKPVIKKSITFFVISGLVMGVLGALFLLGAYFYLTPRLPEVDALRDVQLQVPLRVYASDGELIAEFGEMKRIPLTYKEFPDYLIKAVLAAEDDRFFEHPGVDYQGILRAVYYLVTTGKKGQGGSTITMQVARNFYLSREKTYLRKLNEIFLALKIEKELNKEQILALYLNKIYLGKRAYGFAAAAQVYYGKPLGKLSLNELAMIAGLPKAPSRYNPVVNPKRARTRRNYVLRRMHELKFIDDAQFKSAQLEAVHAAVYGLVPDLEAPYVAEMVRHEMVKRYGQAAYTAGYQVYTTLDARAQRAANSALQNDLLAYDRRHGYRGVEGHVDIGGRADDLDAWKAALKGYPASGNLVAAIVFQVDEKTVWAYDQNGTVLHLPWAKLEWARKYIDDNHVGHELKKASDVLKVGDVVYTAPAGAGCSWLAKKPTVSGALVSLNPGDGGIRALVGGFDFYDSKFNRVLQAKRQPGSSFKPFIYTAALDKGFTPASIINDAPVVFEAPGLEDTWRPENYSGHFYGPTRLRLALIKSRNLVSIRLLRDIGIGYAVRYVPRFGFQRQSLPRDLSLALGSGSLTPLDLAQGYAVFANGGFRVKPRVIDYVRGPGGDVVSMARPLYACQHCPVEAAEDKTQTATDVPAPVDEAALQLRALAKQSAEQQLAKLTQRERVQVLQGPRQRLYAPRVLSPQVSFLMNTMMRDVIRHGTGRGALVLQRKDLAGKTGTTNDQRDAWFAGFSRQLVAIAWVGFDNPRPLGDHETGARAALPMWIDYMRGALAGMPEIPLQQPPGIVSVRIDAGTGELAGAGSPDAMFEYFRADHVPTRRSEASVKYPGDADSSGTGAPAGDITEQIF